jgi:parallel beta-helix repeat protein
VILAEVATAGLVASMLLAAAPVADDAERLWRTEMVRIGEMLRIAAAGGPVPSPPPAARGEGAKAAAADAGAGRRIDVASAADLAAALAAARPGDVIRLADGIYRGNFGATASGAEGEPVTIRGSRAAVLEGESIESGYGFHLMADHWILEGFSLRNSRKGIMTDGASHNRLRGLEVYRIGDEGVHFRSGSSDNVVERSWIHDTGLDTPFYGEAVYVGSAASNWGAYTGGRPDACDRNRVIGNLLGPGVTAEGVDVKEGTTGGEIDGNLFLGAGRTSADSWVDLKGNGCTVRGNRGDFDPARRFVPGGVAIQAIRAGWGEDNRVEGNTATPAGTTELRAPFRAAHGPEGAVTVVLPRRALHYSLGELRVRFPESFETLGPDTVLVREHVLVGPDAALRITDREVRELWLLSRKGRFVSLLTSGGSIEIAGSEQAMVGVRSWDPAANGPDTLHEDGRAYVVARKGRMDLHRVHASDLGFGTGWTSGVAWAGEEGRKSRGRVTNARFERNYFGAYTFHAEAMSWSGNVFAGNELYGFDPHDFSDHFLVTENAAFGNGRHGIIFSRGCRGNVLRGNVSHDNRGHGIMLDDGKVRDDGNPRHAEAVPSNDNLIEQNEVWNNEVGIALEGGTGNRILDNRIHDNEFGIRLEDAARANDVARNLIRGSRMFAIFLYDACDRNRITGNRIHGGRGAIVVKRSIGNVIEGNTITDIVGRGIVLDGSLAGSRVDDNVIAGRGSRPIDTGRAPSTAVRGPAGNHTLGWMRTGGFVPGMVVWGTVLCVPFVMRVLARRGGSGR